MFALTDGDPEIAPKMLGANLAFLDGRYRKSQNSKCECLGPGQLGGGDDVLFYRQVVSAGFRCVGLGMEGTVENNLSPTRLTVRERAKNVRCVWEGRSVHPASLGTWASATPVAVAVLLRLRLALYRRPWRPHRWCDRCSDFERNWYSKHHNYRPLHVSVPQSEDILDMACSHFRRFDVVESHRS